MINLGLICFECDIRQCAGGFEYDVSFYLRASKTWYSGTGTAPSPTQCFDAAMAYLAEQTREAEEERAITERVMYWAGQKA